MALEKLAFALWSLSLINKGILEGTQIQGLFIGAQRDLSGQTGCKSCKPPGGRRKTTERKSHALSVKVSHVDDMQSGSRDGA